MSGVDKPGPLGVRQAAQILGVHPNTVRNWHRGGLLKGTRLAGSGYLRFHRSDIEGLMLRRHEDASDLARGRSMIGPELVDAGQLQQWAEQKFADPERNVPELLRRLVQGDPGISALSMAAGKSVSFAGWDGFAFSSGSTYLPDGNLVFEIGVGARPASKALTDYRKRCADGSASSNLTFVFVTPRLWSGKDAWARKRREEGRFADVRVLDADDIAAWLTKVPDVHVWVSELLGRQPRDAKTVERWWEEFSGQTAPPLNHALFLVGRAEVADGLRSRLADGPSLVSVAGRSTSEALAFVVAVADSMDLDRPWVVVESAAVWERLVTSPASGSVLIPMFQGCEIGRALERGHSVIEVGGETHVARRPGVLVLPRPPRDAVDGVLRRSPWSYDIERAYALAGTFHRSLASFMRAAAVSRMVRFPPWGEGGAVRVLAPLALIGSWNVLRHRDPEDQSSAIAKAVGVDWDAIEAIATQWSQSDDPPLVRTGGTWNVVDVEDVLGVLAPQVTVAERERWCDLALDVLTERDPSWDASGTELPVRPSPRFGGPVRQGIARSLACLAASELVCGVDGLAWSERAAAVVRRVLAIAAQDESGRTWQSLSDVLPLLAEAAPVAFLDAVAEDLESPSPLLLSMFQDDASRGIFGPSSPHTGLLWALEVLCWNQEHLEDAGVALATLAMSASGGTTANSPAASLRTVLIGWMRNTAADVPQKLSLIKRICARFPGVGWELIRRLWPEEHGSCGYPAAPRFRDWRPGSSDVRDEDRRQFESGVVTVGIGMLGADDIGRLTWITQHLGPLERTDLAGVFDVLEHVAHAGRLDSEEQLELWSVVRSERSRLERLGRRSQPGGRIADRLHGLEKLLADPARPERFAHLFAWAPDVPEFADHDRREQDRRVDGLRADAVAEIWAAQGRSGIEALARVAPDARFVGDALGRAFREDTEVTSTALGWAASREPHLRSATVGWVAARVRAEGTTSFASVALDGTMELEPKVNVALAMPADAELWDLLERCHPEAVDAYWQQIRPLEVTGGDIERAGRQLLARGRGGVAIELIASLLGSGDAARAAAPSDALLAAVLRADYSSSDPVDGHAVEVIIEELRARDGKPATVAKHEMRWLPIMRYGWEPKAVYAVLADDPETFVEFVSAVYRGEDGSPRGGAPELELAKRIWRVLHRWDRVPGLDDDGTVDQAHLIRWIERARELFRDGGRTHIGDDQIGQILSASPIGQDGVWPAEAVRHAIETTATKQLDVAFVVGVQNRRGVTTRGVLEGGDQERSLAARYVAWSDELKQESPRTARLLRKIGDAYLEDARSHDQDAAERNGAV